MAFGWVSCGPCGEYERQSGLVLGLTHLLYTSPQTLTDIVRPLIGHIPLIGIIHGEEQRQDLILTLVDWGLPAQWMQYVFMPVGGVWVRDYGPSFVRWSDGAVTILDAEYFLKDRPNDDIVPRAFAALLRLPVMRVPLAVEGGNLLTNGQGLCAFTSTMIERNAEHGYDERAVRSLLWDYYGYGQAVSLHPLMGLGTKHADMFMTFPAADTVLIGECDRAIDPINAEILDDNAHRFQGLRTRSGALRVLRIPMPPPVEGFCRTYTNVIYANGRLLMPTYAGVDSAIQRRAVGIYQQALPGWQIIGVNCDAILHACGLLHCLSLNIPWLEGRFQALSSVATSVDPTALATTRLDAASFAGLKLPSARQ